MQTDKSNRDILLFSLSHGLLVVSDLFKLRPESEAETFKVVMTGSAEDGPEWQNYIRSKDALAGQPLQ